MPPPRTTLFPYTTLFRSRHHVGLARLAHLVVLQRELVARRGLRRLHVAAGALRQLVLRERHFLDRKSTRLNSSHVEISYAVFCLKKKTVLYFNLPPSEFS